MAAPQGRQPVLAVAPLPRHALSMGNRGLAAARGPVEQRKNVGTVWVTGIAGFLGGHVAQRFKSEGWSIAGVGHGARGHNAVDADVSLPSLEQLAALTGLPDVVVHAAGTGAVGPSLADPLLDFQRAVGSTAFLLDYLRRNAPHARAILPSSAAVYGVQNDAPIDERTEPNPVSPYGAHKLAAEIICRQASISFGQPCAVIRFFSLYGPGLRKQLLWDLARRLEPKPETLLLDGQGDEVRDLLFIDDAVELIWQAAHWKDAFVCVNGGTGAPSRIAHVAQAMIDALSPSTKLAFSGRARAGDPRFLCANTKRAQDLGYAHTTPLTEGVRRYTAWFQEQSRAENPGQ